MEARASDTGQMQCFICKMTDTNELDYGAWKTSDDCTVHYFCAVSTSFPNILHEFEFIRRNENKIDKARDSFDCFAFDHHCSYCHPTSWRMVQTMKALMAFWCRTFTTCANPTPKRSAPTARRSVQRWSAASRGAAANSMWCAAWRRDVWTNLSIRLNRIVTNTPKSMKPTENTRPMRIVAFASKEWVNTIRSPAFRRAATETSFTSAACKNMRSNLVHWSNAHRAARIPTDIGNFCRSVESSVRRKMLVRIDSLFQWDFHCFLF